LSTSAVDTVHVYHQYTSDVTSYTCKTARSSAFTALTLFSGLSRYLSNDASLLLDKAFVIEDTFKYIAPSGWEITSFTISKESQTNSSHGPVITLGSLQTINPQDNHFIGININSIKATTSTIEPPDDAHGSILKWTAIEKAQL